MSGLWTPRQTSPLPVELMFVVSCPAALNTMLELSHSIRHPSEYLPISPAFVLVLFSRSDCSASPVSAVIPLKHHLNYEVLEKGHVRFWVQAVKLSPSVSYRFVVNEKEVTSGEVMLSSIMVYRKEGADLGIERAFFDVKQCSENI